MSKVHMGLTLALALALGACKTKTEAPPPPATPAATTPPLPAKLETAAVPAGWSRSDLSSQPNPLPISIALPANAKVVANEASKLDDKGLRLSAPRIRVTVDDWSVEFSYNRYDRTLANTKEMHTSATPPRPIGLEKINPDGTWIVISNASDNELFVDAVNPTTDVICSTMQAPKSAQQLVVDICLSMTKSTDVPAMSNDDSYTFKGLASDHKAQLAAAAVKHAILGNDTAAFVALLPSKGLKIDGKKISLVEVTAKIGAAPLQTFLKWTCKPATPEEGSDCDWYAPGLGATEFGLSRSSGYGKVRGMRFEKQADGSWLVAEISTVDLGEP
jgi:hypothetical protein